MQSSGQKSQIIKRTTFLNTSSAFSTNSRTNSIIQDNNQKKELRRYPTEWAEQIDNKSDNRFHHTIINKSKEEHNPNLASPSKIFGIQDGNNSSRFHTTNEDLLSSFRKKNQSLGNLGSWQFTSPQTQSSLISKSNTSRTLSKRIDQSIPLSELLEISRQLDCSQQDEIRQLSRGYVNQLFQLSQTIERVLRNIKR
ncbi:unnamed protein product [Paramecium pentaurelia]|uniref:Uncharacterized protein n=1 Tax=Paramecium pentaurelia TaxID=43138 RepID=A0A8S1VBM7_9CILI|nr:unnamed protein product [Paramecium pentaurelia]